MNAIKEQLVRSTTRSYNVQDFRSLEVRDREASVEMIRAAAVRQVRRSRKLAGSLMFDNAHGHVASILASAYRLLDPRRRNTRSERVNLSPMFIREDSDFHPIVAQPLIVFDTDTEEATEDASAQLAATQESSTEPSLSELRSMLAMIRSNDGRRV